MYRYCWLWESRCLWSPWLRFLSWGLRRHRKPGRHGIPGNVGYGMHSAERRNLRWIANEASWETDPSEYNVYAWAFARSKHLPVSENPCGGARGVNVDLVSRASAGNCELQWSSVSRDILCDFDTCATHHLEHPKRTGVVSERAEVDLFKYSVLRARGVIYQSFHNLSVGLQDILQRTQSFVSHSTSVSEIRNCKLYSDAITKRHALHIDLIANAWLYLGRMPSVP